MNSSTTLDKALATIIDDCTECGGCVRQCAFLRRFGNPLQQATRYKQGVLAPEVIYSCSLCKLCDVHCPEALYISDMFWRMRCRLVEEDKGPLKQHHRILTYEKWGLSRLLRSSAIPEDADTIFYPGCAMAGTRPQQTQRLYEILKKTIPNLGIALNCCAKPSHDLGRMNFFNSVFMPQIDDLKQRRILTIVTVCPSCHQIFSKYAEGFEVKTVYQILDSPVAAPELDPDLEVCVHDPCSTRFESDVHRGVRDRVVKMGLAVGNMKHQKKRTLCCGEGGSAGFVAPEITEQWAERRRDQAAGRPVITYCAGCVQYLSPQMDIVHLVDLLLEPNKALAGKVSISRSPFTYINRLMLKYKLTRN